MNDNLELHVIPAETYSIILHPATYSLFKAGHQAGEILSAYSRGQNVEQICRQHRVPQDTVNVLVSAVKKFVAGQNAVCLDPTAQEPGKVLPKLELMVSNDCNLNCLYCYAQGGDYGRGTALMSAETARETIDRMLERFEEIQTVVFFGGEPFLNPAAIEAACRHFVDKHQAGEIKKVPYFGTVTNGTLLTERTIDLISRYKIDVTVSIDGPKEINDKLRPFRSGTGSYASIKRGVEKLREHGIHPHFELTYTQCHVDGKIKPVDVLRHLEQELGFPPGYGSIGDAELDDNDPLRLKHQIRDFHEPLLAWSLQNFINGDLQTGDIILSIALQIAFKQARPHICPAGFQSLAVNVSGDIFPCHILVDRDAFAIGNIRDAQWFESASAEHVFKMLENSRKQQNPHCSRCWARYICWGCLGGWKPEGTESAFVTESRCELKKQIWEMVIRQLMKLKDDPARWPKFEANLKKIVEHSKATQAGLDVNKWLDFGDQQSAGTVQRQPRSII